MEEELQHMIQEAMESAETHEPGYLTLFKGEHQWPMIVAILMMFSQQFSGEWESWDLEESRNLELQDSDASRF